MVGLLSKPCGLLAKRSGDRVPLILDSLKRALKNRAQVFAQSRPISDPKSTQTIPQAVRNSFASMQEAFQGVWSDFWHLAKSTIFTNLGL